MFQSVTMLLAPIVVKTIVSEQFSVHQLELAVLSLLPLTANAVAGLFADGTSSQGKKAE